MPTMGRVDPNIIPAFLHDRRCASFEALAHHLRSHDLNGTYPSFLGAPLGSLCLVQQSTSCPPRLSYIS